MSGFTKGPWQAIGSHESEGFDCYWINAQPNPAMRGFTKEIAAVTGPQGGEAEANARLIAASPTLLEAVIQYRDDLKRPPTGDSLERRLAMVNAAIAKALGEQA